MEGTDACDRRWPAAAALLLGPFRPATLAVRTDRAPLWAAWLVHVTALAALVGVLTLLEAYDTARAPLRWTEVAERAVATWRDLVEGFREPGAWLAAASGVGVVELATVFGAALLTPWGARDERLSAAFGRALRRSMLLTPLIPWITGLAGFLLVTGGRWRVHDDLLLVPVIGGAWVWGITALLRGVGAGPRRPRCVWPPACERCGYTLDRLGSDVSCAECGEPSLRSVDDEARPGEPWRRRRGPRLLTWLPTAAEAIFRPTRFAQRIRLWDGSREHRVFLVISLLVFAGACVAGFEVVDLANTLTLPPGRYINLFGLDLLTTIATAAYFAMLALLFLLTTAAVVGAFVRRGDGRTMLGGAARAACYASGWFAVWALALLLSLAVLIAIQNLDLLEGLEATTGVDSDTYFGASLFVVFVGGFVVYVTLVATLTRQLAHCNR